VGDSPAKEGASVSYIVELTEEALAMLGEIQDRRVRAKLFERIQKLADEPEKQGKALVDALAGFRSVRAIGQRYRIVYVIEGERVKVIVVGVGIRKGGSKADVYARMTKRVGKS
jgi:mRNA interferase RelE/StbE